MGEPFKEMDDMMDAKIKAGGCRRGHHFWRRRAFCACGGRLPHGRAGMRRRAEQPSGQPVTAATDAAAWPSAHLPWRQLAMAPWLTVVVLACCLRLRSRALQ